MPIQDRVSGGKYEAEKDRESGGKKEAEKDRATCAGPCWSIDPVDSHQSILNERGPLLDCAAQWSCLLVFVQVS